MIGIVVFALIGAPMTTALLWSHSPLEAIVAAPLGGSFAALCGAALIAFTRSRAGAQRSPRITMAPAHFGSAGTAAHA